MKNIERYVEAVMKEVERRKEKEEKSPSNFEEVDGEAGQDSLYEIETLYFGGGTPTLLPIHLLEKIMNVIYQNFDVDSKIECTIEGNPEQLSFEYLTDLKSLGFNRISIGIQSFNDDVLHFLGRTHSRKDAFFAIENAQSAGFENISIDLMYGIYLRSLQDWTQELKIAFQLPVKHLSAYSLTVEENTLLHKKISQQKLPNIDEEQSLQEMKLLIDEAGSNNFEHYEVSNFALKNYHSRHNSNYWNGTPYLGFGASAHSFTGTARSWNISNVEKYMKAIEENESFFEIEHLTPIEQYNETILLGLRTKNGIDLKHLEARFGTEKQNYLFKALQKIDPKFYKNQSHRISITKEGLALLDFITASLLFDE
jgi:oxygen-independent coproporphyrinogen-3 oxidase